jgi:hypothetical protein
MTFRVEEVVPARVAGRVTAPSVPASLVPDLAPAFPARLQKRQTNIRVLQIAQPARTFGDKWPS